uniref:Uncharacterized protein n=1 Tax=Apis cerana TaxID=7461 RepID=V9IBX8_APICE
MDLCNGHCGLMCYDSDEEEDSSPTNSPISTRRIVPSSPLPPRRPSPSPTPNSHSRNGRHLTVPKENAHHRRHQQSIQQHSILIPTSTNN